jgi:hypothetical protein
VTELHASLEFIAQSWIDARSKRRVNQLREATGSNDTFIFDDYMMCCDQHSQTRKMELYTVNAINKDPVAPNPTCVLTSPHFSGDRDGLGLVGVECYDAGQDLLALVHVRKNQSVSEITMKSFPLIFRVVLSLSIYRSTRFVHSYLIQWPLITF